METNKELLLRIEKKVDDLDGQFAQMQLDIALKFSNMRNASDKRFQSLEGYLKSDPSTKQEGAIEKLSRIEKWVIDKDKKDAVRNAKYGMAGAGVVLCLKWVITKLFL